MNNNVKNCYGLAHPPLSGKSLIGCGSWVLEKPFFCGEKHSFTLAEVLITLTIIGVIAAITIPNLMKNYQTHIFKTAYKQAYSDINQAFAQAFKDGELIRTTTWQSKATTQEWNILKENLKVTKECQPAELYSCWAEGDVVHNTQPQLNSSLSFIDAAGRSWSLYHASENLFLVDTNGFKEPNKFGQDRFMFTFYSTKGTRTDDYSKNPPVRIGPFINGNRKTEDMYCNYPPCYYYDWLYK